MCNSLSVVCFHTAYQTLIEPIWPLNSGSNRHIERWRKCGKWMEMVQIVAKKPHADQYLQGCWVGLKSVNMVMGFRISFTLIALASLMVGRHCQQSSSHMLLTKLLRHPTRVIYYPCDIYHISFWRCLKPFHHQFVTPVRRKQKTSQHHSRLEFVRT